MFNFKTKDAGVVIFIGLDQDVTGSTCKLVAKYTPPNGPTVREELPLDIGTAPRTFQSGTTYAAGKWVSYTKQLNDFSVPGEYNAEVTADDSPVSISTVTPIVINVGARL